MLTVYHGSDHVVKVPVYMGGKPDNDYGNGFYTTEYEERARSWAALNGNPQQAVVNVYQLDMDNLKVLDFHEFGVLAWVAEVVANRGMSQEAAAIVGEKIVELYRVDSSECDLLKGYRADDSYTQVIEAFLMNQINISEVERLFYKGSLGNQIFLKSEKAFESIHWVDAYDVTADEKDRESDIIARKEVNKFLSGRMKAILLDGFQVPGITAQYAINNQLIHHQEGDYYEQASV